MLLTAAGSTRAAFKPKVFLPRNAENYPSLPHTTQEKEEAMQTNPNQQQPAYFSLTSDYCSPPPTCILFKSLQVIYSSTDTPS